MKKNSLVQKITEKKSLFHCRKMITVFCLFKANSLIEAHPPSLSPPWTCPGPYLSLKSCKIMLNDAKNGRFRPKWAKIHGISGIFGTSSTVLHPNFAHILTAPLAISIDTSPGALRVY